ncbi:Mo-dependent nitrogenase C-terminal domain-containing protein [Alkalinema sp. FACHB-956]|uniref:Mo-dependent nitrogenase C-terminal domain-containing protein n=1 Tax=Alkalinema sp. FACHB-956 TaxID=2692768 RepID=UPI0032200ED5
MTRRKGSIAMTMVNSSANSGTYTDAQIELWLRGLLTLAWADGDFDESEKQLIASLTHHEITADESAKIFQPVQPEDLKAAFGSDKALAENFLRTAVMVALSDGTYTTTEDEQLTEFAAALDTSHDVLDTLRLTLCDLETQTASPLVAAEGSVASGLQPPQHREDLLQPVRTWLDGMEVDDPKVARFLCKLIPSQCPFERDVVLFGKKIVHIPPMCKVNPLYEQLVGLRFRALSFLADRCGEDVTPYI